MLHTLHTLPGLAKSRFGFTERATKNKTVSAIRMSSFNLCATQLRTPLHSLSTHKRFYFKFAFYNAEAIPKSLNAYFSAGVCEDLLRVGDFRAPTVQTFRNEYSY